MNRLLTSDKRLLVIPTTIVIASLAAAMFLLHVGTSEQAVQQIALHSFKQDVGNPDAEGAMLSNHAQTQQADCLHDHACEHTQPSRSELLRAAVLDELKDVPDVPPPFRKCGFSTFTVKHLNDIVQGGQQVQLRRETEYSVSSPSGRFLIHYDLEGFNAVDPLDENANSIPDYIDSVAFYFDQSWQVEIDEMGFLPPPSDGNAGGSSQYDIYVDEMGPRGLYGLAFPENNIGPGGAGGRFTTYIIIDNNFSSMDSTGDSIFRRPSYFETGIRALRVTAAHEFHHAIQLGAYGNIQITCSLHELTSTWIEFRVHPDVFDAEQFIPNLMRNLNEINLGSPTCSVGYHYGIFTQMLDARHGDAVFLEMWQEVRNNGRGYDAFDKGLRNLESSLPEEYCEFSDWLYYTGYRTRGTELQRAEKYPLLTFHTVEEFSEPSVIFSGQLKPLEQRFVRLFIPGGEEDTPDTIDVAIVNTDVRNAGVNNIPNLDYTVICTSTPQADSEPLGSTGYHLQVSSNRDADFCYKTYVNAGVATRIPQSVFPSPFVPDEHSEIHFPLEPAIDKEVQSAVLTIYDSSQQVLFSDRASVSVVDEFRVISWDGRTDRGDILSSGVYLYMLEYQDNSSVGKFVVLNSD